MNTNESQLRNRADHAEEAATYLAHRLRGLCRAVGEYLERSTIDTDSQVAVMSRKHCRDAVDRTREILSECEYLE